MLFAIFLQIVVNLRERTALLELSKHMIMRRKEEADKSQLSSELLLSSYLRDGAFAAV